VFFFGL